MHWNRDHSRKPTAERISQCRGTVVGVYGYTRVSTDKQANEGESLGAQKRTIEGYAMMLGLAVTEVFVERGVSGSTLFAGRPQGAKLLAALKPGAISGEQRRSASGWARPANSSRTQTSRRSSSECGDSGAPESRCGPFRQT
jgi:hypothetical protein